MYTWTSTLCDRTHLPEPGLLIPLGILALCLAFFIWTGGFLLGAAFKPKGPTCQPPQPADEDDQADEIEKLKAEVKGLEKVNGEAVESVLRWQEAASNISRERDHLRGVQERFEREKAALERQLRASVDGEQKAIAERSAANVEVVKLKDKIASLEREETRRGKRIAELEDLSRRKGREVNGLRDRLAKVSQLSCLDTPEPDCPF